MIVSNETGGREEGKTVNKMREVGGEVGGNTSA
jgi:hypothetical protein